MYLNKNKKQYDNQSADTVNFLSKKEDLIQKSLAKEFPDDFSFCKNIEFGRFVAVGTNWNSKDEKPFINNFLPEGCNVLKVTGIIKFHSIYSTLFRIKCPRDHTYGKEILKYILDYAKSDIYQLCLRYANNIANGIMLGRNIDSSVKEKAEIIIKNECTDKVYKFNPYVLDSINFSDTKELAELAKEIEQAFNEGYGGIYTLSMYVEIPSNKFIYNLYIQGEDKSKNAVYYNSVLTKAIHTVDTWYESDIIYPITITPVNYPESTEGRSIKLKNSIHYLFQKMHMDIPLTKNEKLFVLANIIRGGVFGRRE